jgi:protease II
MPFVDVWNAMRDDSLPLTVHEYDEWGNPNDPTIFHYILHYDPYQNVRQQMYPHMLVTTSLRDLRVPFWQPLKWVAKLRALNTAKERFIILKYTTFLPDDEIENNLALFRFFSFFVFLTFGLGFFNGYRILSDVGHFGEGGRYGRLQELAFEYAFLYMTMRLPLHTS